MKKIYALFIFCTAICTFTFVSFGQSVLLPESSLSVTPMGTVENNGTAMAEFLFAETSGVDVPENAFGEPNVTINVNLQYVALSNLDISQITGTILDYFTAAYNSSENILTFTQSEIIPADWNGFANFPISVTQNSSQSESYNGFNANIAALDAGTNAMGNSSVFTYTDESVLNTVPIDPLNFSLSPNPTTGIFTINLANSNDTTVELFDILGKLVRLNTYTNTNTIVINIEELASAVYVCRVTATDGATNTVKIIRE